MLLVREGRSTRAEGRSTDYKVGRQKKRIKDKKFITAN
jgi:hypothetical protein